MKEVLKGLKDSGARSGMGGMALYLARKSLDCICVASSKVLYVLITFISGTTGVDLSRTINGSKMVVKKGERGIHEELILYGKRERFSTDFLAGMIQNDDVIVDIGANVGYYALLEGRIATHGRVFAVEPVAGNMSVLKTNIEANQLHNITTHPIAIGDRIGKATIFVCDHCNWSSPINNYPERVVDKQIVEMEPLDTFIERVVQERPSLVRMDVEGYEAAVMRGAAQYLEGNGESRIFVEIHPSLLAPQEFEQLISGLRENGYKVDAVFREFSPGYKRWFGPIYSLIDRLDTGVGFGYAGSDYDAITKVASLGTAHVFFSK
ncbi:MAG TPA: FkbM family methyltransferase [Methanomassiliicoccales archaeon]|nr:FkbM family methyltransferase [Methanomassiliicoccales archaeon]